jgi:two-component system response regulator AtoC
MTRVLVVDDERKMRRVMQMLFERMGLESYGAETADEALARARAERVDLVVTDLRMPGMDGLELLAQLRELDPDVPVIVMTAYGTVETAIEAMKRGAVDYVLKPFDIDALELIVRRTLDMRRLQSEHRFFRDQEREREPAFVELVGSSPAMQSLYALVRRVAPTRSPVLVTGETGTGKELVAHAVHELSPRAGKLFVPVNCAAIPNELLESELFGHARGAFTGADRERVGKFELADGGTLFLDEIGDMPYGLQAKLLRVLQEGVVERLGSNRRHAVDVRVVSSTHRDLPAAVRDGRFREDLYYRLNVLQVQVPTLRERRDDVPRLAAVFLERTARELGRPIPRLTPQAEATIAAYDWPGNVRELKNVMERVAVLTDGTDIGPEHFAGLSPSVPVEATAVDFRLEPAVEAFERRLILRALDAAGDNKAQAARLLGISERTLWYKLKRYNV